jgi:steroid 5-alpha reductase family enzyme
LSEMDRHWRKLLGVVIAAYTTGLAASLLAGWLARGAHPLLVAALADLAGTAAVFGFSVAFDNSSVYDPYWSVAPLPLALYWAALGDGSRARQALVLVLVAAWGVRLTGNCLWRWRDLGHEDFRYREIRARTGRWYWPASFVSIHLMPTIWVFLGLVPVWVALGRSGALGLVDALAAVVTAAAVAVEAVADWQLQAFLRRRTGPDDVLASGLWALSRHPNYFGEVLFWWGLWLFGLAADPSWWWTVVGPVSITLLFAVVSVPWMDRRMLARHPAWAAHVARTSALVPWPSRQG